MVIVQLNYVITNKTVVMVHQVLSHLVQLMVLLFVTVTVSNTVGSEPETISSIKLNAPS